MRYRVIPTPPPPDEAELDTAASIEAEAAVERNATDVARLEELADLAMDLARAQHACAKARLVAAAEEGGAPLKPGEDPAAGFNKIAQSLRRIIALKTKLSQTVDARRAGLRAERDERRAQAQTGHRAALEGAVIGALRDAVLADRPDETADVELTDEAAQAFEERCEALLDTAEFLLADIDDYSDWASRPVGETVARLCHDLDLAADACVRRGDTWFIRHLPTATAIAHAAILEPRPPPPTPSGDGGGDSRSFETLAGAPSHAPP